MTDLELVLFAWDDKEESPSLTPFFSVWTVWLSMLFWRSVQLFLIIRLEMRVSESNAPALVQRIWTRYLISWECEKRASIFLLYSILYIQYIQLWRARFHFFSEVSAYLLFILEQTFCPYWVLHKATVACKFWSPLVKVCRSQGGWIQEKKSA